MPLDKTDRINAKIEQSRKELLDLGRRNPLLNFKLTKRRGVQVVEERSSDIFRLLVTEIRKMSFLGMKEDESQEELSIEDPAVQNSHEEKFIDRWLQTPYDDETLQRRLLGTYYHARTYLEERGVNILFISLGTLHWYPNDSSGLVQKAPLILIPVELSRTSAKEKFRLMYRGEEVGGNISLGEKLSHDFKINIPELSNDEEFSVSNYISSIDQSISGQPRWKVEENEITLGFFAFGKFLMYKDLDVGRWPEEKLPASHPILASLLEDGFRDSNSTIEEGMNLDDVVTPGETYHVLDADSSQLAAALEIKNGSTLVIQGPPGTGKSQTITNVIAQAIGDGKHVLFVAEKMAALDVVKRKLDSLGLGDACLELHSHNSNKKSVLAELQRTHELHKPKSVKGDGEQLLFTDLRSKINKYCHELHEPVASTEFTPFEVVGRLVQVQRLLEGVVIPDIPTDLIREQQKEKWTRHYLPGWNNIVSGLQVHIESYGLPSDNAYYESQLNVFLSVDPKKVSEALKRVAEGITNLEHDFKKLAELLNLPASQSRGGVGTLLRTTSLALEAPPSQGIKYDSSDWRTRSSDLEKMLEAGSKYAILRVENEKLIREDAWSMNLGETRDNLVLHGEKWWRFFISDYRRAQNQLKLICKSQPPKELDTRLHILDRIAEASSLESIVREQSDLAQSLFGAVWNGLESDWDDLIAIRGWVEILQQDIDNGQMSKGILTFLAGQFDRKITGELKTTLKGSLAEYEESWNDLKHMLKIERSSVESGELQLHLRYINRMQNESDTLRSQVNYNLMVRELKTVGFGWLVQMLSVWESASRHSVDLFHYCWFDSFYRKILEERPKLAQFDYASHEENIKQFRNLDTKLMESNRIRVALQHYRGAPSNSGDGQVGILLRQFHLKRRHMPIRQLLNNAGAAIQALKPVFMMSPMSIASFLDSDGVDFDLVVFDEASQVKPVEAFGAILRGKQLVVVGDDKQLPPTSFFDVQNTDDDDDESVTSDMESILGLMQSQGAQGKMLKWHYRSIHESLIATSNHLFYGNKLVVFPSAGNEDERVGLHFNHFPGATYDRGGSSTNIIEAEKVVEAVFAHVRDYSNLSLGVATFNIKQAELIRDLIEKERKEHPEYESFFAAGGAEPFFVKNLESVQGDEREVIFVCIGYGRTPDGRPLSMNFGPLNNDGGERRLNVLITRARRRCEVFSSITHTDIDLSKSSSFGLRALKVFLRYAETRILETENQGGEDAETPFEDEVGQSLIDAGYRIERQVGSIGYRIDIAVRDENKPGRYVLAIECDGASYHSSKTAKDRDKLRQAALEIRGWRFHRVWSTDWFQDRKATLDRLIEAVERAKLWQPASNPVAKHQTTISRIESNKRETGSELFRIYEYAVFTDFIDGRSLSELSSRCINDLIAEIVEIEGPIHKTIVKRRIVEGCGIKRLGTRIEQRINDSICAVARRKTIHERGQFLWWHDRLRVFPRNRENLDSYERNIELVAPQERQTALLRIVRESHGIDESEVRSATLRILGLRAISKCLENLSNDLRFLVNKGYVEKRNNQLFALVMSEQSRNIDSL